MKLGIMQPYFFPYIGYWQLLDCVDAYVVFDDVNFKKRSWITRNRILCDGNEKFINLQVSKASQNDLICDTVQIFDRGEREKLLQTLNHAYRKAPYKKETLEFLEPLLLSDKTNLADFLYDIIAVMKDYLGCDTKLYRSSELRDKEHSSAEQGIIDLCLQLGADHYINPIGGTELYDKENFTKNGLKLNFLRTDFDRMRADNLPYISDFSIIDLMMNLPPERVREQLKYFELL